MRTILFVFMFVGTVFADCEQQLTDYLSKLVAMETVTADKGANKKALDWVEKELKPIGLHIKRHVFNGHPVLIATTRRTKHPDIFLAAHIDVVPAPQSLFQPKIIDEKMFGRGCYDMKMAIACYLLLFQELKNQVPALNIGLMLTSDEEIGGMNGVKRLLELGYSSNIVFLPDGGFDWHFEEEAKGVLQINIGAAGKSSHSSRPDLGENAIEILMASIEKIRLYFKQEKIHYSTYYPTANVGIIHGGTAVNQVPAFAEANIDIRYPPAIDGNDLYEKLVKILQEDSRISVKITAEGSPHKVDVEQIAFKKFKEIANSMYAINVGKTRSHGASDARFFSEKNIPVLMLAPAGGAIHSNDEWIDLKDLSRFYQVLKQWVLKLTYSNDLTSLE